MELLLEKLFGNIYESSVYMPILWSNNSTSRYIHNRKGHIYSLKYMDKNNQSSTITIHNSPQIETTQTSLNMEMEKLIKIYSYNSHTMSDLELHTTI